MKYCDTDSVKYIGESPPSRGAWIEINLGVKFGLDFASPPSRGAWIEIPFKAVDRVDHQVAPLAGGVD